MAATNATVDIHNNPFYCPAIPAHRFLYSLRRKRDKFKSKVYTCGHHRFVLRPFSAALDWCLFKGGGDSDDDSRQEDLKTGRNKGRESLYHQFQIESEQESEGSDELDNISFGTLAHTMAQAMSFRTGRKNLLTMAHPAPRSVANLGDDGSDSDGGFVTVPLTLAKRRESALSALSGVSGLRTLKDRSGNALFTTSRRTHYRSLARWRKSMPAAASVTSQDANFRTVHLKRKSSSNEESDHFLSGSVRTKRARSNLSVSNSSFYVTVRREKLQFVKTPPEVQTPGSSSTIPPEQAEHGSRQDTAREGLAASLRPGAHISNPKFKNSSGPLCRMDNLEREDLLHLARALQDELFGPFPVPENPAEMQELVKKLDSMLSGIRLKERLTETLKDGPTYQALANFLSENGYLNAHILELFRASQVTRISLGESLKDANGLNLMDESIFFVFSKPNSFRSLTSLSLDGCQLQAPMLTHLQHLPQLSALSLFDSGIDNEAIYLLVPLKYTLEDLNVAQNPGIDDDAVPALLVLTNLLYLSAAETSIGMPGARKLVKNEVIGGGKRTLIDLPHCCHEYVENMDRKYLVDLTPPLVSNPELCNRLSAAALKRNLVAHAAVNREIQTDGTKREMVQRLEGLLRTRLADLEVRRMIRYPEGRRDHSGEMGGVAGNMELNTVHEINEGDGGEGAGF